MSDHRPHSSDNDRYGSLPSSARSNGRHDESFIERFRAGDPDAVSQCADKYLAKFTLRLWKRYRPLLSRDRCEEIVIDSIELAWEKREQFNLTKGCFEAWLWGITRHCLADVLRKGWFQEYHEEKSLAPERLFLIVDPIAPAAYNGDGPDEGGGACDLLAVAMRLLSAREHAILSADMDSLSGAAPNSELSAALGLTESTVRWHRARGLAKLRDELLRLGYRPAEKSGGGIRPFRVNASCALRPASGQNFSNSLYV